MTTVHSQTWNGVLTSTYMLDKGEHVGGGRHRHSVEHSTQCVAGEVDVAIYDDQLVPRFTLRPGEFASLAANIDHDIVATVDGTIVVNCIAADSVKGKDGEAGQLVFE
jgi:quercetin dioxygenase-like cupin family protein